MIRERAVMEENPDSRVASAKHYNATVAAHPRLEPKIDGMAISLVE
jgi:hypothetical protein